MTLSRRSIPRWGADPKSLGISILLTGLVAMGAVSTDLYLPSLPAMVTFFGADVSKVQLTLSVFTLGMALGMVIHGPLSDRFGRRPVLLGGLALYFVASMACVLAPDIEALIVARFVQALGACCGIVVGRAIVRDVHGTEGAARMLSYMTSAMALAPALAPILGGWLHVTFGWWSNFLVLVGFGAVILACVALFLGETNQHRDPSAVSPIAMGRNFLTLLGNRTYLGHALVVAFTFGGLFSFISGSSFVIIDVLGVRTENFGFVFFFFAMSYTLAAIWGGRVSRRRGLRWLITLGIGVGLVGDLTGLALAWAGVESIWSVMPFICAHSVACAFIMPNGMAGAIGPFPRMAGAASSLLGFTQMAVGSLAGYAVGALHDGTTRALMTSIALCIVLASLSWGFLVLARRSD
jgi:DHA1 family bicyclomycin/chloramphenicol resistance-like MFS transporter